MKISTEQIRTLAGFVARTTDQEISCETCESQLGRFAEAQLAGAGVPVALQAIEEHLGICPECKEELDYIYKALDDNLGG